MSEIGEAFIVVKPDIEFGDLFRDVNRQINLLAEVVETQTESMENSFRELGDVIENTLRESLQDVAAQAERIGESIQNSFEEAARQSDAALNDIGGALVFDQVARQAESTGERIESSFREAARQSERHLSGLSVFSGTAFGSIAAQAAAALGRAVIEVGQFGLELASQIEIAQSSFEAFLGDTGAANALMDELRQFAIETPFDFGQITESARRLLAVKDAAGLTREEIIPTIAVFGDLITTLGQPQTAMNRVILAFGQIASRGKVVTQELRQLSEALPGFNPFQVLADGFGISTAEMTKMVEDGLVPAQEGLDILVEGMRNFPGAAGGMARFTDTLSGQFQRFKDALQITLADGFQPLIPIIKTTLNEMIPLVDAGIQPLVASLTEFGTAATPVLISAFTEIGAGFSQFFDGLLDGIRSFGDNSSAIIGVISEAFAGLGEILRSLGENLGPIISIFAEASQRVLPQFADIVVTAFDALGPALEPVAELIASLVESLMPALGAFIDVAAAIVEGITPALEVLGEALEIVGDELADGLIQIFEELEPEIPDLTEAFTELAVALSDILVALTPLITPLAQLITAGLLAQVQVLTILMQGLALILDPLAPVIELVAEAIAFLVDALEPLIRVIAIFQASPLIATFGGIYLAARFLYENAILPLAQALEGPFTTAWETVVDLFNSGVSSAVDGASDALNFLWNEVLVPFGGFVEETFVNSWQNLVDIYNNTLRGAVEAVVDVFIDLWENVLVPVGDFIGGAFTDAWNALVDLWNGPVWSAITSVDDVLSDLWDVLQDIGDFISNTFITAWEGVSSVVGGAVQTIGDLLGWLNDEVLQPIVNFIDNGLIPSWDGLVRIFQVAAAPVLAVAGAFVWLWEQLQPLRDFIGGVFTEAWQILVDLYNEQIGPAIGNVSDAFSDLWTEGISPLIDTVGTTFSDAWNTLGDALAPIGETVTIIKDALNDMWTNSIEPLISQIGEEFSGAWEELVRVWQEDVQPAIEDVKEAFTTLKDTVGQAIEDLKEPLTQIWEDLVTIWREDLQPAIDDLKEDFNTFLETIRPITDFIQANWIPIMAAAAIALGPIGIAIGIITLLINAFDGSLGNVVQTIVGIFVATLVTTAQIILGIFGFAIQTVTLFVQLFGAVISGVAQVVLPIFGEALNIAATIVTAIFGFAIDQVTLAIQLFSAALSIVVDFLGGVFRSAVSIAGGIISFFGEQIGRAADIASSLFGGAIRRVADLLSGAWSTAVGAARDIASGFGDAISGVSGFIGDMIGAIRRAIEWIGDLIDKITSIPDLPSIGGGGGIPLVPFLARGALIDRPTLAVVGEAGPEVVLPLNDPRRSAELLSQTDLLSQILGVGRPQSGGGVRSVPTLGATSTAGTTVIVNQTIDGDVSRSDAERIANATATAVAQTLDTHRVRMEARIA